MKTDLTIFQVFKEDGFKDLKDLLTERMLVFDNYIETRRQLLLILYSQQRDAQAQQENSKCVQFVCILNIWYLCSEWGNRRGRNGEDP